MYNIQQIINNSKTKGYNSKCSTSLHSNYFSVFIVSCSGDTFREMMLIASQLGMTTGEYVFIIISLFNGDSLGDFSWRRHDSLDEVLYIIRFCFKSKN